MLAVLGKIFGGIALLVAVVALMSTPQQAAKTAGNAMGTLGIVTGSFIGAAPDLMTGFKVARNASEDSGINQGRGEGDGRRNARAGQ